MQRARAFESDVRGGIRTGALAGASGIKHSAFAARRIGNKLVKNVPLNLKLDSFASRDALAQTIYDTMETQRYAAVSTFCTVYTLLVPELQQVFAPKTWDIPLAVVTFMSFLLFTADIVLNFVVKRDYGANPGCRKITVFFVIDVIGTIAVIPDFLVLFGGAMYQPTSAIVARAARAARIGARMGRVIREMTNKSNKKFEAGDPLLDIDLKPRASMVGLKLGQDIAAYVVIILIVLMMVIPVLHYSREPNRRISMQLLRARYPAVGTGPSVSQMREYTIWWNTCEYSRCVRDELIYIRDINTDNTVDLRSDHPDTYSAYRDGELIEVQDTASGFSALFQVKEKLVAEAQLTLAFIIVAIIFFTGGSALFVKDVQLLVVAPMEELVALCEHFSETLAFLARDKLTEGAASKDTHQVLGLEVLNEVDTLDLALEKMVGLLQAGYGEAGTQIISRNLQGSSAEVDPLVPGLRCDCVIAFIVVEDFEFLTECFEGDIMLFANYVSEVIHDAVVESGGSPNKNMGNAILCVWKGNDMASNGLQAFEQACAKIGEHRGLNQIINGNDELTRRRPGYAVSLKLGLHLGWVIEGAVGSSLKIDASYLSPNVNLSARFMTSSWQYGVDAVVGQECYDAMDAATQRRMRCLDRVLVKGSDQPMILWSPTLGEEEEGAADEEFGKINAFTNEYCAAVHAFIGGDWAAAERSLRRCSEQYTDDLAPKNLLAYMSSASASSSRLQPPDKWPGYHALTKK